MQSLSGTERKIPSWRSLVLFALLANCLVACATAGYYTQSISGHIGVMIRRQPITRLTSDPVTPEVLRQRLYTVGGIREFAVKRLGLPDNGSYQSYADLKRDYVVRNVFSTPEFSLTPLRWCFLFVGCLEYRGYYEPEDALRFARELRSQGNDVFVGGVAAYSTLGWFKDPVLNTMLRWDNIRLAKVIFHELAHQKLYVKGDTAFNEAFATKVAQVGVGRWLAAGGSYHALLEVERDLAREEDFIGLVLNTRARLTALYNSALTEDKMRAAKRRSFDELRTAYEKLKTRWKGYGGYDDWMSSDLNNAKLSSLATYHSHIPAFDALLEASDNDLNTFYELAAQLGRLPDTQRAECLDKLSDKDAGLSETCLMPAVEN